MEELLAYRFTWMQFLGSLVIALALYLLLRLLEKVLKAGALGVKRYAGLKKALEKVIVLYEPLAILLLVGMLIFVNPYIFGLAALLVGWAGFTHIRNYLGGRMVFLQGIVMPGKKIRVGRQEGQVETLGKMGLRIRNDAGLHFINYQKLLAEGYSLLSGEDVGDFCHLKITPMAEETKINHADQLSDLLATTPFLNWNFNPEIQVLENGMQQIEVRMLLRENRYLPDLKRLIEEWGYDCQIISSSKS